MDRFLYQLTVLASATCVGIIFLSILFPSHRRANLANVSSNLEPNNLQVQLIQSQEK